MDICKSFSPSLWAVSIKFLMMGGVIAVMVLDILQEQSVWWMAYFSNWGWSCVVAYFVASFCCCVGLAKWPKTDAGLLVKMTWVSRCFVYDFTL
jgi:hypothetical protein